jgi:hypothetical protein
VVNDQVVAEKIPAWMNYAPAALKMNTVARRHGFFAQSCKRKKVLARLPF